MVKDLKVAAQTRESRGKNEARRLRVKGLVPAVVYGGTEDAAAVSVDPKEINKILHSKTGHNTIFQLSPADAVISHVVSLRAEESTTAETGGTAAAEPEVVKKGKKEEEGGETAKKK